MNIREVARRAGVSASTVSRVLNGTKAVSPEVRARVFQAVYENGYIPNTAKRHSRTIAVVIPKTFTSHGWSGEILDGILDGAGTHPVMLIREESLADSPVHYWHRQMLQAGLKGVLLVATERTPALVSPIRELGIPYVIIGRGEAQDHWVWCDNALIIAHALEMLYRQGHRRIAFIGFSGPQPDHSDRLNAYRCYMSGRGLERIEVLLEIGRQPTDDVVKVLDDPDPPTAFFVAGSNTAAITLSYLTERGKSVPQDLAFVAIGPHPTLETRTPPIPLVERRLRLGAQMAVENLLNLHEGSSAQSVHLTLPSRLVCGDEELVKYPIPDPIRESILESVMRGAPVNR